MYRADEVVHSGLIDVPMYELLLKADVVVADISTSNRNAIYELGVRHALRPYTTVIIAEEQMMKSPFFDLNHIVIRTYKHLGEDIGVSEAKRFTTDLTKAIKDILTKAPELRGDSPVYQFLKKLTPPALAAEIKQATAVANKASLVGPAIAEATPAHSALMAQVDEAQRKGDWLKARILLEAIREARKQVPNEAEAHPASLEDPYILQRLALATYKSKHPTPEEALKQARDLLGLLDPRISNDTETLGLWGAVHKHLWDLTTKGPDLDQAVRGYERGFYLRNDPYNGINFAFLLNVRAAHSATLAEAIADFVQARRIRREVISICEQWLKDNDTSGKKPSPRFEESRYWILATIAEAYLGLEEESVAQKKLSEAFAAAPEPWMKESTQEQIQRLKSLLADSPLKKLPT